VIRSEVFVHIIEEGARVRQDFDPYLDGAKILSFCRCMLGESWERGCMK
jgi:hypothetical protein